MRLIVTGGAGFVGSSLAIALAERHPAWEIVALDNLFRRGSELNLPRLRAAGVHFAHGDVRRPEDLAALGPFDAMAECSAEPSVMAAGEVIVPVNLVGAYHCFEAARRCGAHVVFLSTSRVYPVAAIEALAFDEEAERFEAAPGQAVPGAGPDGISEEFPLAGRRTMYGASKLAAELLLAEYENPWSILRFGVIAGPWQLGKVDQGVFTYWARAHVAGRPLSYIGYGGAGKQVRDLLHVADAVELVEHHLLDRDRFAGRTHNAGGGRAVSLSLREATALCRELTGNEVPVASVRENRPGDVPWYLSDCSALYARTDWRPRRTARDVLADTVHWIQEHGELLDDAVA